MYIYHGSFYIMKRTTSGDQVRTAIRNHLNLVKRKESHITTLEEAITKSAVKNGRRLVSAIKDDEHLKKMVGKPQLAFLLITGYAIFTFDNENLEDWSLSKADAQAAVRRLRSLWGATVTFKGKGEAITASVFLVPTK
jgi:hypothetical protein